MSYEYSDGEGVLVYISDHGDCAHISLGATTCCLISNERKAAAQELAGDGYRVVPISEDAADDRDECPRVQGTCPSCGVGPLFLGLGGHVTCSWVDCEAPEAADGTLQIGLTVAQPDRPGYPYADGDTLVLGPETFIDWPDQATICHKGENYTRQPDRPEPVDPASVKVGDIVTVEAEDGSWTVRGEVDNVDPGSSYPFRVLVPHMHAGGIWPRLGPSNIRILHAAEPEPDEAAVEAIEELLGAHAENMGWVAEPSWQAAAEYLVRNGVRVVSSDG